MSKSILIQPFAKQLRNGNINAKNYPFWNELIFDLSNDYHIIQIGVSGEKQLVSDFRTSLSIDEISSIIDSCATWISVDSFLQHLAWSKGKKGIVLFGKSDPEIFGHKENINLLKSRTYLRTDQFGIWEAEQYNQDVFVRPDIVLDALKSME